MRIPTSFGSTHPRHHPGAFYYAGEATVAIVVLNQPMAGNRIAQAVPAKVDSLLDGSGSLEEAYPIDL